MTKKSIALIGAVLMAGLLTACGAAGASNDATETTETTEAPTSTSTTLATTTTTQPTTTTTQATTTTTLREASYENPLDPEVWNLTFADEFGDMEWEITYHGAHIGTAEVLAENMFNDPPEAGSEFVIIELEAVYTGKESANFWWDFEIEIVGGKGNTFGGGDFSCGVAPNQLSDVGDVYAGGVVAGNECIAVPVDQLDGARLMIGSYDVEPGYFWLGEVQGS